MTEATAMFAVRRSHRTFDNVTVSESLNDCWRHTCSETTALCNIFSEECCLEILLLTSILTYRCHVVIWRWCMYCVIRNWCILLTLV